MLFAQTNNPDHSLLPAYYVSLSKPRKEVVVAIRGTDSWKDAVRDVVAIPNPIEGTEFAAHRGIQTASLELCDLVFDLCSTLSEVGFNVVVCGHRSVNLRYSFPFAKPWVPSLILKTLNFFATALAPALRH